VNNETNTYHTEIRRILSQNSFISIFVSHGMDCEVTAAYQMPQLSRQNQIMESLGESADLYKNHITQITLCFTSSEVFTVL
jgi:hypothetical protein